MYHTLQCPAQFRVEFFCCDEESYNLYSFARSLPQASLKLIRKRLPYARIIRDCFVASMFVQELTIVSRYWSGAMNEHMRYNVFMERKEDNYNQGT